MRNVLCYSQRYEESFFRLENSHLGEAERSPESHQWGSLRLCRGAWH